MKDVPQPADEPYSEGDRVRVYLAEDDPDSRHHNTEGKVKERQRDSLDEETGRELDSYTYRITVDGETLNTWFRHRDLVPVP